MQGGSQSLLQQCKQCCHGISMCGFCADVHAPHSNDEGHSYAQYANESHLSCTCKRLPAAGPPQAAKSTMQFTNGTSWIAVGRQASLQAAAGEGLLSASPDPVLLCVRSLFMQRWRPWMGPWNCGQAESYRESSTSYSQIQGCQARPCLMLIPVHKAFLQGHPSLVSRGAAGSGHATLHC